MGMSYLLPLLFQEFYKLCEIFRFCSRTFRILSPRTWSFIGVAFDLLQMSAAAFAKGLLDLEGQLTPILVSYFFKLA